MCVWFYLPTYIYHSFKNRPKETPKNVNTLNNLHGSFVYTMYWMQKKSTPENKLDLQAIHFLSSWKFWGLGDYIFGASGNWTAIIIGKDYLAILCAFFGMVKWPLQKAKCPSNRAKKRHFESLGTGFFPDWISKETNKSRCKKQTGVLRQTAMMFYCTMEKKIPFSALARTIGPSKTEEAWSWFSCYLVLRSFDSSAQISVCLSMSRLFYLLGSRGCYPSMLSKVWNVEDVSRQIRAGTSWHDTMTWHAARFGLTGEFPELIDW